MATWNSRGLRGSSLEDIINFTIDKYEESGIQTITDRGLKGMQLL